MDIEGIKDEKLKSRLELNKETMIKVITGADDDNII